MFHEYKYEIPEIICCNSCLGRGKGARGIGLRTLNRDVMIQVLTLEDFRLGKTHCYLRLMSTGLCPYKIQL